MTAQTPSPGATGVSTIGAISATFSEPIQPGTISFTLKDASGNSSGRDGDLQWSHQYGQFSTRRFPGSGDSIHGDRRRRNRPLRQYHDVR